MPHFAVSRHGALALALCLAAALTAAASADDYSDYRIPDHRLLLANVGVQGSLTHDRADNPLGASRSWNGRTDVLSHASWTHASEKLTSWADWDIAFQGDRGHRDATQLFHVEDSHDANAHEHAFASYGVTVDPGRAPFGYDAQVLAGLVWEQRWAASHARDDQFGPLGHYVSDARTTAHAWIETRAVEGRAGVHVGRVRDATAVGEARLLERRLLRHGVLSRPLGPDARRSLAWLADIADDLRAAHDRPAKFVWAEVERILRDDGALRDTSGAGILAAQEAWVGPGIDATGIPRSPIGRSVGWSVKPYVAARHDWFAVDDRHVTSQQLTLNDTLQFRNEAVFGFKVEDAHDRPLVGLRLDYHRPIGDAWQLDVSADAQRPVDRDRKRAFYVTSGIALSAIVTERLLWTIGGNQARHLDELEGQPLFDGWATYGTTSLQYYIEDHVALILAASTVQQHAARTYQRRDMVRVGIDYRLARRVSAPGLTPI